MAHLARGPRERTRVGGRRRGEHHGVQNSLIFFVALFPSSVQCERYISSSLPTDVSEDGLNLFKGCV